MTPSTPPPLASLGIAAAYARGVLEAAAAYGVPRAPLLEAAGLAALPDDDPHAFVPFDRQLALWSAAAAASGDDCFGLHAGDASTIERLGTLGHVLRSSATVGDALAQAMRYERLMYSGYATTLERRGAMAAVRHEATHPGIPVERHPIEYVLALVLRIIHDLATAPVRAAEVRFRHAPPSSGAAEHERVFGCPVRFGAAENALLLPAAALGVPLRGADAGVAAVLASHADGLLARVQQVETTAGRVRAQLPALLRDGEPTLESVGRAMAMSARTLQRRLADEGTTFQRVLDEARQALATAWLAEGATSVGEVAFLTGFADARAFRRAFQRWTGQAPSDWVQGRRRRATNRSA